MIALPTFQTCSLFKDRAMSRRKSREEVRSQPSSRSLGGTREPQSLRDPWTAAGAGSSQGTVTGWWESNKDALYPLALDSLNNQVLSPGSSSKPPSSTSHSIAKQCLSSSPKSSLSTSFFLSLQLPSLKSCYHLLSMPMPTHLTTSPCSRLFLPN